MSLRLMRPFIALLAEQGVDMSGVTIDGVSLDEPDGYVPYTTALQMLSNTENHVGMDAVGIRAVDMIRPSDFDVPEYAGIASATLGEAIEVANSYQRLFSEDADFRLEVNGDQAKWRFGMRGDPMPRPAAEFVVALFALLGRRMVGRPLRFIEIRFAHDRPEDISLYEQTFGCPIRFNAGETAMVFAAERLQSPLPRSDPGLKAVLERVARRMLDQLPASSSWTDQVRKAATRALCGGNPGIEAIAEQLHQSPRTLRRRLQEEGTSYTELLDDLRQNLAKRYLCEGTIPIAEIAYQLGFSDPSAFHRAFKRWTGTSAVAFRERQAGR